MIRDIQHELAVLHVPRWAARAAPLYRAWMTLAFILGWIVLRILLILLYAFLMVPLGIFFRLTGRDPLSRRLSPEADSYWIMRTAHAPTYLKKF